MKKTIFIEEDKKRLYKIVINNQNIDIYQRIPKKNKYERIDYKIQNYIGIYFGYNLCNIRNEENGYLTTLHNSNKFTYSYDYNSIGSVLILLSESPYTYIYLQDIIYLFIIDEPVKSFNLIHDVFGTDINKPLIKSYSFLKTKKYTYNLNKYLFIHNENINIDLHSYLNLRPYNDEINEIIYEEFEVYIKENNMNKNNIIELFTEEINNFDYESLLLSIEEEINYYLDN